MKKRRLCEGGITIKQISGIILLVLTIVLGGCSSEKAGKTTETESAPEADEEEVQNEAEGSDVGDVDESEYPMPILEDWEEIEVKFEEMSEGRIEIWSGEFEYEGPTGEQFELYQTALTDAGFAIEETDDTENMQTIEFTKTIEGKDWVGNTSFNQRWIKSGLQHFK